MKPGANARAIALARKIIPDHVERALRHPLANKAYGALSNDDVMRGRFGHGL